MSHLVRIKICGITRPDDALRAAALGVEAIGLNFAPQSPRCIDHATAVRILEVLPADVEPVAVFVEQTPEAMLTTLEGLPRIRMVQLHGELSEQSNPLGARLWRAYQVRGAESLPLLDAYLTRLDMLPAALVLDGYAPGQHGGTGQTAPWELLATYRSPVPIILAGGLRPDNVAAAIQCVRPYMVDVASGVESRPGWKDADKMKRFVTAVRSATVPTGHSE